KRRDAISQLKSSLDLALASLALFESELAQSARMCEPLLDQQRVEPSEPLHLGVVHRGERTVVLQRSGDIGRSSGIAINRAQEGKAFYVDRFGVLVGQKHQHLLQLVQYEQRAVHVLILAAARQRTVVGAGR